MTVHVGDHELVLDPYDYDFHEDPYPYYKRLRDEAVQPDGKVYYVPREATIMQLWYRQDILKAKGVSTDQPKSWQELLDRARQAYSWKRVASQLGSVYSTVAGLRKQSTEEAVA